MTKTTPIAERALRTIREMLRRGPDESTRARPVKPAGRADMPKPDASVKPETNQ